MAKLNNNLSITENIDALARWIIVHSTIYYEYNFNVVSDMSYDAHSKLLLFLINNNREKASECHYWYLLNDFDGNTGFDLRGRLKQEDKVRIDNIAFNVIKNHRVIK